MSFARVSQIAQTCKLTSIDQLLPLLPDEYRERYTLVYNSRSIR